MAEVIRYVDPDATGAGNGTSWTDAYTSLDAWNTGEATDLETAGDWHHVYVRASSGTADTTAVTITDSTWTTTETNYIHIEAADGDQAVKTGIDTNRYRTGGKITLSKVDITFEGIQFNTTANGDDGIEISNQSGGTVYHVTIKDCYFKIDGDARGVECAETYCELTVENTICVLPGAGSLDCYNVSADNAYFYHCVAYNAEFDGFEVDAGTAVFTNCVSFGNGDLDFDIDGGASGTITNCASDDGDGTNAVSPSGGDWSNEFSDPANGDFTLLNTGNLYQGGTTIAGGPSTDIDGDSWGSPPSIGADEYDTGSTSSALPVMMAMNQFMGGL